MIASRQFLATLILLLAPASLSAFTAERRVVKACRQKISVGSLQQGRTRQRGFPLWDKKTDSNLDGVVELADDTEDVEKVVAPVTTAPFLSQGEIDPEALNPDLSDPKQARVVIYIIISLLPVLFLIPLMLGSRELIPLDAVPPVQL
jgi:hypothetical protein